MEISDHTLPARSMHHLPRKRGRPKQSHPKNDSGTPELIMKRLLGETLEALDLCLERGYITPEQHGCGIHFRWLHILRYGITNVRAVDPTHMGGIEIGTEKPEWRIAREKEYHDAMDELSAKGYATIIVNICIYDQRPKYLYHLKQQSSNARNTAKHEMEAIRTGLDLLQARWKK